VVDSPAAQNTNNAADYLRSKLIEKVGPTVAAEIMTPRHHATKGSASAQATISYEAEISNGAVTGTSTRNSINDATAWKYYSFYGTQGDVITITVNRTGCGIDPAFSLYKGTTTSSDGLAVGSGNSDMTWLLWQDDDFLNALGCGCQKDPKLADYEITESGWYTITVFDFQGCGDEITYQLEVSGLTETASQTPPDSDGDGVADDDDPFPTSDTQAYIVIGTCETGVANQYLGDGTYMKDLILNAAANATSKDAFTSAVSNLADSWKSNGLISGKEKGKITSCAAKK
jgi:hypothetical protein